MHLKQTITHNLLNIPGWHTNRKIVVIESDDWGSVRMPSREVYEEFLRRGVRVDRDPYCRYDSLATADDLSALFDVLTSVKDKNGRHAVLTADTVVANPVFEKIKASDFREYFYEPFTETLKRSPRYDGAWELWQQGMDAGIFHPLLHGREHLNVKKWLRTLQSGEEVTRLSFDLGTFGLTSAVDPRIKIIWELSTLDWTRILRNMIRLLPKGSSSLKSYLAISRCRLLLLPIHGVRRLNHL